MSTINDLLNSIWMRLHRSEEGQDTAEYLVMTAVVVGVVAAVIFTAYSGALTTAVGSLSTAIGAAMP